MAQPKGVRKHGNHWKGGRTVDPRGYVLIWVGKDHPLADVRGYAYEHRLKAKARRGQLVHHDNERKGDNSKRNLVKVNSIRAHRFLHRGLNSKRRQPGEKNSLVACACGCGTKFRKYDGDDRPRRFCWGHNVRMENNRGRK